MSSYEDQYDYEIAERSKSETDLDRYWVKREAELQEREAALRERESEALAFYHSTEAAAAADAARWRACQLEITEDMDGAALLKLYKKHGV